MGRASVKHVPSFDQETQVVSRFGPLTRLSMTRTSEIASILGFGQR